MKIELIERWKLSAPFSAFARGTAPEVELGILQSDVARRPWRLSSSGEDLELSVGPLLFEAPEVAAGLELFRHRRASLALEIPGEVVVRQHSAFRVFLDDTSAPLDELAASLAPIAASLLHAASARELRLWAESGAFAGEIEPSLLPETFDVLVPVIAAFLACLAEGSVEADEGTFRSEERVLSIGAAHDEAAVDLWRRAERAVARCVPSAALVTARRWLGASGPNPTLTGPMIRRDPGGAPVPAENIDGSIEIVPFRPGGRPLDELLEPGTGCSDFGAFLRGSGASGEERDKLWIVFRLTNAALTGPLSVRLYAWFLPPEGSAEPAVAVPGMLGIPVPAKMIAASGEHGPVLGDASYSTAATRAYIAELDPERQLLPAQNGSEGYRWEQVASSLLLRTPDGEDPFTFCNFFRQRVLVQLEVRAEGKVHGRSAVEVTVYDTERFGSLYGRLLELVGRDTEKQARSLGAKDIYLAHHPWYPVLGIGMNKAALYMKAIHQDLAEQTRHFANPHWLIRVGLYLEYLTCVGIFEAVKDDYPELLSPGEREYYASSPVFAEIRKRIDVPRWKKVWALRGIVGTNIGPLNAGPVSFTNLLRKQEATLEFLHAHHADLMHAVFLAGPNVESSQEVWHRVFRDAERAVVNSSMAAFPELRHVPGPYRDFILWHQRGEFGPLLGAGLVPKSLTSAFGDQDGLYPGGAREYRASMNDVAAEAKRQGLMDFAGAECVPREVSLIEALLDKDEQRFARLQARDGYGGTLYALSESVRLRAPQPAGAYVELLQSVRLFDALSEQDLKELAARAKVLACVPTQDVVVQGQPGSSLFIVESGTLRVIVDSDRGEQPVRTLVAGEVFGEMAFLTGDRRGATVRSIDYSTLLELDKSALAPIIERAPHLLTAMSTLLAARRAEARGAAPNARGLLLDKVQRYFFGNTRLEAPPAISVDEASKLLREVDIFRSLSEQEIGVLARAANATAHQAGARIVAQGEKGSSLFLIAGGSVEVLAQSKSKTAERKIARLGLGAIFGEMAMLTGERRAASVVAVEPVKVLELSRSDLLPIISRRPGIIIEISELLALRSAELQGTVPAAPASRAAALANRVRGYFFG
jgi:CRP-like cAMP-binding protein